MNTELKNKNSFLQIFSAVIVYSITIGYIFENQGQRTIKLTKILIYLQRLNIGFFIFKKVVAFNFYYYIIIIFYNIKYIIILNKYLYKL